MTGRNPAAVRAFSQANALLAVLEMKNTAALERFWPQVPTVKGRAAVSLALKMLAIETIAGLPAHRRVAAGEEAAELHATALRSTSAVQHVASIYGQAQHVIRVMTERFPDQRVRLRQYKQGF